MTENLLSKEERQALLKIARQSIERAVRHEANPAPALVGISGKMAELGATFVTLTVANGELRGCIGTLEARQPLVVDVWEHAEAAALEDPRFSPVTPEEVDALEIEISYLTPPKSLEYDRPEDLPGLLRPHQDGVVLHDGGYRATFLPQVWDKLPDPQQFLANLCQKMGAPADYWRRRKLKVEIYQVEEFREEKG